MSGEVFVDTNILVYAFDESEKGKRPAAKQIILDITTGKMEGVISSQTLGELFNALTRKIEVPVRPSDAQTIVAGLADSANWKKINYNEKTVKKAAENSANTGTPFWDALIIETMLENKAYTILTENTKHFQSGHIRAINPFTEPFKTEEENE